MMDFLFIKVGVALFICFFFCVLGLARTGLIFTRIQQGTQPGGLTQPGQTEPGIPYHVPSCWVPVGGAARQELTRGSGVRGASPVQESGSVAHVVRVVFSPYLYRCCYCSLLFAVLLNCPYPDPPVFCLFLSILLRTPAGGGVAAWRFCCQWQQKPKYLNWRPSMGRG